MHGECADRYENAAMICVNTPMFFIIVWMITPYGMSNSHGAYERGSSILSWHTLRASFTSSLRSALWDLHSYNRCLDSCSASFSPSSPIFPFFFSIGFLSLCTHAATRRPSQHHKAHANIQIRIDTQLDIGINSEGFQRYVGHSEEQSWKIGHI